MCVCSCMYACVPTTVSVPSLLMIFVINTAEQTLYLVQNKILNLGNNLLSTFFHCVIICGAYSDNLFFPWFCCKKLSMHTSVIQLPVWEMLVCMKINLPTKSLNRVNLYFGHFLIYLFFKFFFWFFFWFLFFLSNKAS
jgi:hypothetical protein